MTFRFPKDSSQRSHSFATMQITVQMLDGSITPFRVRSSITIASLKAKFEPWQPMKGRALLHHDAQLDDRATLDSVPGVKNGTVLRVDKCVSQLKKKTNGKKTMMSGPASSAFDEDVMESIEKSDDDDEISGEDERRMSSSKRRRLSSNSAALMEDLIDDDSTAKSLRERSLSPGDTRNDPLNMTDTGLSNRAMALRIVKKEKRGSIARQQAIAPEAPNLRHELQAREQNIVLHQGPLTRNATAITHMPKITAAVSTRQTLVEDSDTTFLAGINAAAGETDRRLLESEAQPAQDVPARQCTTCGRACGCATGPSTGPLSVMPPNERVRGHEYTSTKGNNNDHLIEKRASTSQRAESSWTGM